MQNMSLFETTPFTMRKVCLRRERLCRACESGKLARQYNTTPTTTTTTTPTPTTTTTTTPTTTPTTTNNNNLYSSIEYLSKVTKVIKIYITLKIAIKVLK